MSAIAEAHKDASQLPSARQGFWRLPLKELDVYTCCSLRGTITGSVYKIYKKQEWLWPGCLNGQSGACVPAPPTSDAYIQQKPRAYYNTITMQETRRNEQSTTQTSNTIKPTQ